MVLHLYSTAQLVIKVKHSSCASTLCVVLKGVPMVIRCAATLWALIFYWPFEWFFSRMSTISWQGEYLTSVQVLMLGWLCVPCFLVILLA